MISSIALYNTLLVEAFLDRNPISLMKMQRLLYIIVERYFTITNIWILNEMFEAWDYGPVLKSLYERCDIYNEEGIREFIRDREGKVKIINEKKYPILKTIIKRVYVEYKNYNGIEISKILRKKTGAWYKAYIKYDLYISKEDIMAEGKQKWRAILPNNL